MGVFFSAKEMVRIAVRNEETGLDFYRLASERAKTPELKRLFDDLAVQEQAHKARFLALLDHVQEPAQPDEKPADPEETGRFIAAMTDSRLFEGEDKNIALAAKASDGKSAVEFALGFEKDTLLFFYQMLEQVRSADRALVEEIIREEKSHIRRLAEIRKELESQTTRS